MPQFSVAPLFPIPYTTTTSSATSATSAINAYGNGNSYGSSNGNGNSNVRSSIDSMASDGMIMPVYKG